MSSYVGLRIPDDLLAWIDEQAAADGSSRTKVILDCISEQKADLEKVDKSAKVEELKAVRPVLRSIVKKELNREFPTKPLRGKKLDSLLETSRIVDRGGTVIEYEPCGKPIKSLFGGGVSPCGLRQEHRGACAPWKEE